jgi:hypothetical protein
LVLLTAEPTSAAAGLTVTPAFQMVSLSAAKPTAQYTLTLGNSTTHDQNFRLTTADFKSLDESGGVAFLGTPASELDHPYGLASWMRLEKDTVFVPAGKSAPIIVTVDNRSSLAPGGHYGAVLATAVTDTGQPYVGDPRVGVRQVISSLILLTKEGGAEPNLKLVSQTTNGHVWRLPSVVTERFQNSGNLHLVPRGVVEVRDPAGRVVERGAINPDSGIILPESFRRYQTDIRAVTTGWVPGRYSLVASYRYDGTDQTSTVTISFWYLGTALTWLVIAIILILLAGLIWWWLRHRRRRRSL